MDRTRSAVLLAAFAVLGCLQEQAFPANPSPAAPPAPVAFPEWASPFRQRRMAYEAEAESRLADIARRVDAFFLDRAARGRRERVLAEDTLSDVRRLVSLARLDLEELRRRGGKAWERRRSRLDERMGLIEQAFGEARERLDRR